MPSKIVRQEEITQRHRVFACCRKIAMQFGESPEERLFCSIVQQAIRDAFLPSSEVSKREVLRYIRYDLWNAEACGIDANWVRKTIVDAGLPLYPQDNLIRMEA